MLRSLARIPPLTMLAAGFVLGLILAVVLLAPGVGRIRPADGALDVPSTSRISLLFNREMNQASVEARFSVEPPQAGSFSWSGDELTFTPEQPWPAGAQVTIRLRAGALGRVPLPVLRTRTWRFTVGQPRVLYLWPASGAANLYLIAPGGGTGGVQLTFHETGLLDYTLAVGGTRVFFALSSESGGQDLYQYDLIGGEESLVYACPEQVRCSTPAISPDERWLAFVEQHFTIGGGGRTIPSGSSVMVLDLQATEEPVQVSPGEHTARDPAWSPQGWLTYFDEELKATALLTFEQGPAPSPFTYLPNSLGASGSWSPDGTRLVYPEIVFLPPAADEGEAPSETAYYSHLYQTDVTRGETSDISPGSSLQVEDASPVFSPDGGRLAFARKYLDPARWTPGRQLWVLELADQSASELTAQPKYTFSAISWNPDSMSLAYMRRDSSDLSREPEIWTMDLATQQASLLVQGGFLPQWIP